MNQQEVMREAARLSAGRRRRVTRACSVCGKLMEGTVRRRFCSDACKLRAQRQKVRAQQGAPASIERLDATRERIMRGRVFDDSTEILRELREGARAE